MAEVSSGAAPAPSRSAPGRRPLPLALASLLAFVVVPAAVARGGERVAIQLAERSGSLEAAELVVAPDPVVISRARPELPVWRLDPEARGVAPTYVVSFEDGGPFVTALGTSRAEDALSLGPLRVPIELGSYGYRVRLVGESGEIRAEGRAAVEIRESAGLSSRIVFLLAAIGVLFLLCNYLDPKPLTRSYEH